MPSDAVTRRFNDLERALDTTHAYFDQWIEQTPPSSNGASSDDASDAANGPDEALIYHAQMALHEWLANLMQHADFGSRTPEVAIHLRTNARKISCTIVDNSNGFPFESQLDEQVTKGLPFQERAMGLRIIDACAEQRSYHQTPAGRYQFTFSISTNHTPWLSNLF